MNNRTKPSLAALLAATLLAQSGATAASLIYQWNFNSAATGTSVTPATGAGGVLGLKNNIDAATDLYSASGTGPSGGLIPNDRAFDSSSATAMGNAGTGPVAASASGNVDISSISTAGAFSFTGWFNPSVPLAGNNGFARLFHLSENTGYAGGRSPGGIGILLIDVPATVNSTIEFSINNFSLNFPDPGFNTAANTWTFYTVTFDDASNTAQLYWGSPSTAVQAVPFSGTLVTTLPTATELDAVLVNIANRDTDNSRPFRGLSDDIRIYSGVLTGVEANAIRLSAVPEASSSLLLLLSLTAWTKRRVRH